MSRRLLVVAGIGAFMACVSCNRQPTVDLPTEANTIRELDRRWVAAVASKDVQTLAAFYSPDGVLMSANAPAVVGRDAIRKWFEAATQAPNLSYTFTPEVIDVAASGDLAYDRGTYQLAMDTPQGRIEDNGKYVAVWKKIGGEWKVVADIMNSDRPPASR